MSRRRLKLRVGDVFSIPVDDDRVGYGQIVSTWGESGGQFYFAVFDGAYPSDEEPDFEAVLANPVILLALSMDALLVHGHWQVFGNAEVDLDRIPWPAYKEGVSPPGAFDVVDASGQRRRSAADDEAARLPFRTVVAPIRVEKAFRALNGTEPWDEAYDALRPVDDELTAAALLPADEAD
jgi:Immunity protein 26